MSFMARNQRIICASLFNYYIIYLLESQDYSKHERKIVTKIKVLKKIDGTESRLLSVSLTEPKFRNQPKTRDTEYL